MVKAGVVVDSNEFKVFKSVVRLDTVSVVNVLSCCNRPSKVRSHEHTVLKVKGSSDPYANVSIRANKSPGVLHPPTAVHRTKSDGSALDTFWLDEELGAASITLALYWHIWLVKY